MRGSVRHNLRVRLGALLMLPLAAALLAGCEQKETGPEEGGATEAPVIAPSIPAATAAPQATAPLATFEGRDANGDGRVSSAEYAAAANTVFAALDADRNGSLTVTELDAARLATGFDAGLSSEKIIDDADTDSDEKLTLAEFIAAANARFDALDRNQDGFLDHSEWDAGQTRRAGEAGAPNGAPPPN